jgi:hypothetical protein
MDPLRYTYNARAYWTLHEIPTLVDEFTAQSEQLIVDAVTHGARAEQQGFNRTFIFDETSITHRLLDAGCTQLTWWNQYVRYDEFAIADHCLSEWKNPSQQTIRVLVSSNVSSYQHVLVSHLVIPGVTYTSDSICPTV